jgi:hypothetical protein
MKRITTAREQFDMLSPWLVTAEWQTRNPEPVRSPSGEMTSRPFIPSPEFGPALPPPKKEKPPQQPRQLDFWDTPSRLPKGLRSEDPRDRVPALEGPRPQRTIAPKSETQEGDSSGLAGGWEETKEKGSPAIITSPKGNQYTYVGDNLAPVLDGKIPQEGKPNQPVLSPELPSKGGAPKDPEWESLSSNLARFLSPSQLERSVMEKYNAADDATKEAGAQWYDTANEYIRNLAEKTGRDPAQVAAIVSAFSPQTSWDANMAAANYFLMNYDPENPDAINDKMGGLGDNLKRAKRIHAAGDEDGYLAGLQNGNDAHKITNFYHNLMGSKDHVTIDSWMARALLGQGADGLADKSVQKVLNWKDGYDTMSQAVVSAAQKLSQQTGKQISPRDLQAIVWSHVVPTAGDYKELSPEEYRKQKKQRETYVNNAPEGAKLLPDYFHGPGWESRPTPTYDKRRSSNRFWQKQADVPRTLYRGIHLNLDAGPGEVGYVPPGVQEVIKNHGINSRQFLDSFSQSTWGTRFTPQKSIAESFANAAPAGIPSALISVDWDGNDRAADPHPEMSKFPDSWFGGDRPVADPSPFDEVRLKPGKQLKVRSLQVRHHPEQGWKELLDGPTVMRTAGITITTGIQDNTYSPEWKSKAEQLARGTGGFSIHDDPNNPDDGPTSGYQVAIPGYENTDINTGQGWADWASKNQDVLRGNYMGTWHNNEDGLFYTEPSENISDYDQAARATVDRDQWSMWNNGAFHIDPATGQKVFLPQADISRSDIINQGLAGALGFTHASRGISARQPVFYPKRFWKG